MSSAPGRLLRQSLRARLLLTLLLPLVGLATIGWLLDVATVERLSGASDDRALASTAIGLAARVETERDGDLVAHLDATARAVTRLTSGRGIHYLVLDAHGTRIAGETGLAVLVMPPQPGNPAFADAEFEGTPVRLVRYRYEGPDGQALVFVSEPLALREAGSRSLQAFALLSNLAMVLTSVALALLSVQWALRPLGALGERVAAHDVDRLQPLPLRGVPLETRALVRAINRLIARVRRSAQSRQAFINHTAHQLRTPLAGLQAQLALLRTGDGSPAAARRLADAQQAAQRLSHLTQQMLALARVGDDSGAAAPQRVRLNDLLAQVASHRLDMALEHGIDLGFEPGGGEVVGVEWMLRELLLNLVGNAIVHTPRGSAVTVRCGPGDGSAGSRPFIEVLDDGPGIAPADRERVFERFVRLSDDQPGSGLGLAIVREIGRRHGASVRIGDCADGRGTRVNVRFAGGQAHAPP